MWSMVVMMVMMVVHRRIFVDIFRRKLIVPIILSGRICRIRSRTFQNAFSGRLSMLRLDDSGANNTPITQGSGNHHLSLKIEAKSQLMIPYGILSFEIGGVIVEYLILN